jgi:hypothetical protein
MRDPLHVPNNVSDQTLRNRDLPDECVLSIRQEVPL